MSCQPSANDLLACFFLAVSLFAATLIPFFLLVDADHLVPRVVRVVREAPERLRPVVRDAAVSAAALLMVCTPASGVAR